MKKIYYNLFFLCILNLINNSFIYGEEEKYDFLHNYSRDPIKLVLDRLSAPDLVSIGRTCRKGHDETTKNRNLSNDWLEYAKVLSETGEKPLLLAKILTKFSPKIPEEIMPAFHQDIFEHLEKLGIIDKEKLSFSSHLYAEKILKPNRFFIRQSTSKNLNNPHVSTFVIHYKNERGQNLMYRFNYSRIDKKIECALQERIVGKNNKHKDITITKTYDNFDQFVQSRFSGYTPLKFDIAVVKGFILNTYGLAISMEE